MMHFIFFLIFLNSNLFMFLNHPLSLGLSLFMKTLLTTLTINLLTTSFWFSYILFLIFIGGMLILFLYMTSLAANEIYKINFKKTFYFLILLLLMLFFLFVNKNLIMFYFKQKISNNDILNFKIFMNLIENENILINKMMNFPINLINMMLICYLFICLIAVVKISNIYKGPLRSK